MKITTLSIIGVAFALGACSTIVNGSDQAIKFASKDTNGVEVEGADCSLTGGSKFAVDERFKTPAVITVPRSKKPLELVCNKPGYRTAKKTIVSEYEVATAGNIFAGGFIGAGVDAATGALYKYPDVITVKMPR